MLMRNSSSSQYVNFTIKERKLRMSMTDILRVWRARWEERRLFARELTFLPDETLKDFGMTRDEAYEQSHRPFWRP